MTAATNLPPPEGDCTECSERCVAGETFRQHHGHPACLAPLAVAALASDIISIPDAQRAVELVELYLRARLMEAQRRARHAAIAREVRSVVDRSRAWMERDRP
jgi:hypothetical protein